MHDNEDRRVKTLLASAPHGSRCEIHLKILMGIKGGGPNKDIARKLEVSKKTVWKVRRRYSIFGLEGVLEDAPRTGRNRRIRGAKEEEILSLLLKREPPNGNGWTGKQLASAAGLPQSTTYKYLEKLGVDPNDPRAVREALGSEQRPTDVVGLLLSPRLSVIAFACDNGRPSLGATRATFSNHRGNTASFCQRTIGSVLRLIEGARTSIGSLGRVASDPADASIFAGLVERRLNCNRGAMVAAGLEDSKPLANLRRHCEREPLLRLTVLQGGWQAALERELGRLEATDNRVALGLENLKGRLEEWVDGPDRRVGTFAWLSPRERL